MGKPSHARWIDLGILLAWGGLLGSVSPGACAAALKRPNILWITAEDLSPDLGCYGDPEARTPNLDRLAAQGARFTRAFTVAPVCAPSRSCIITGMYPTTIGTHHMRSKGVPPDYVKCFTEYLRAAGYYCTNNAKTDYNFDSPITAWDESSTSAHWRNRSPGQPFFAVFNLFISHESQIRIPAAEFAQKTKALRPQDRHDPARANLPPYYPDTPETRGDWTRYYDLVTTMDLQAAALLKQLDDDGLAGETIVFFFGDHGRGLPRAKRWPYDSGLRVPLLVRWPGKIAPGTVREDLVSFVDLAPTILDLADVTVPSYMQGQAFLGEHTAPPRSNVFAARDRMDETYDIIRSVRDERFRYIRNFQAGKPYAQYIDYMEQMPTMQVMRRMNKDGTLRGAQKFFFLPEKPPEELYDTAEDPHEVRNLAALPDYRDRVERMRKVLEDWMRETHDLGPIPEPILLERMRPGGRWAVTAEPSLSPRGGRFNGPVQVTFCCVTPGASIAYTTDAGTTPKWQLYHEPVTLRQNGTLRAKSCRLGYTDSPEVKMTFEFAAAK